MSDDAASVDMNATTAVLEGWIVADSLRSCRGAGNGPIDITAPPLLANLEQALRAAHLELTDLLADAIDRDLRNAHIHGRVHRDSTGRLTLSDDHGNPVVLEHPQVIQIVIFGTLGTAASAWGFVSPPTTPWPTVARYEAVGIAVMMMTFLAVVTICQLRGLDGELTSDDQLSVRLLP